MSTIDEIRARHAALEAVVSVTPCSSLGHEQAHADRGALLAALDRAQDDWENALHEVAGDREKERADCIAAVEAMTDEELLAAMDEASKAASAAHLVRLREGPPIQFREDEEHRYFASRPVDRAIGSGLRAAIVERLRGGRL